VKYQQKLVVVAVIVTNGIFTISEEESTPFSISCDCLLRWLREPASSEKSNCKGLVSVHLSVPSAYRYSTDLLYKAAACDSASVHFGPDNEDRHTC